MPPFMPPARSKNKLKNRVLLIDDDDNLRKLHGLMLAEEGYQVSQATNGLEAVSLCQCHGFDLVIVELHLQGRNNLELIESLRSQTSDSKFIGTARLGSMQPDYSDRMAKHLGAQRVLTKPFPPDLLILTARDVLTKN
jgi:DNA-binding response OmpR family regulator